MGSHAVTEHEPSHRAVWRGALVAPLHDGEGREVGWELRVPVVAVRDLEPEISPCRPLDALITGAVARVAAASGFVMGVDRVALGRGEHERLFLELTLSGDGEMLMASAPGLRELVDGGVLAELTMIQRLLNIGSEPFQRCVGGAPRLVRRAEPPRPQNERAVRRRSRLRVAR